MRRPFAAGLVALRIGALRFVAPALVAFGLIGCDVLGGAGSQVSVLGLDGAKHTPLVADGHTCTVLVFVMTDCPIANAYAPVLREIVAKHAGDPVRFWLVHSDPSLDVEAARAHASAFELPGTVVLDRGQSLLRAAGATTTPQAIVYDRRGNLVYRGRIDDWYADLGVKRQVPTTHELRDAIAAALRGQEPAVKETEVVGCAIRAD